MGGVLIRGENTQTHRLEACSHSGGCLDPPEAEETGRVLSFPRPRDFRGSEALRTP